MSDAYVREIMEPWMRQGTAREFLDTQAVFDALKRRFPIGLNRIAWEKVVIKEREEILPRDRGTVRSETVAGRLRTARGHVRAWLEGKRIQQDTEIVWVGDNTEFGLSMTVGILLECFPGLFSLPQHSYALPRDGAWCLNYVMEDELFFAMAPPDLRQPKQRNP